MFNDSNGTQIGFEDLCLLGLTKFLVACTQLHNPLLVGSSICQSVGLPLVHQFITLFCAFTGGFHITAAAKMLG